MNNSCQICHVLGHFSSKISRTLAGLLVSFIFSSYTCYTLRNCCRRRILEGDVEGSLHVQLDPFYRCC
uniref:Uncharacterized protein n=1 Tax=Arundo donax TaxID=35708 RepID=A0A0A8Y409_ARUDO